MRELYPKTGSQGSIGELSILSARSQPGALLYNARLSINHSVIVDFADIMHQDKQSLLDISLGFGA
jgi:hypothetical protein